MTDARSLCAALSHEVHVWYTDADAVDADLLGAYWDLLSADERARNQRFVFERHRRQDLLTRALVRTVLSAYRPDVDPRSWQFASGSFGRPEIAAPRLEPALNFNLSHAEGLVACLVGGEAEIGVDVEGVRRTSPTLEIADRFFSAAEARALREVPPALRPERFRTYWTLKEAYIKARGLGLQIPLNRFTIEIKRGQSPGIAFGPEIEDDPRTWQLMSCALGERHRLAVALRRHGRDLGIRLIPTVPLVAVPADVPSVSRYTAPADLFRRSASTGGAHARDSEQGRW